MTTGPAAPDPRFDLLFEQRPGYLYARVAGPANSLDIATAYWRALEDHCRRRRPQPMLVVEDLHGVSPDREDRVPDFTAILARLELRRFRIAVVKRSTSDMGLAEAAGIDMQSLGWDVRLFSAEGEATLWLLHGKR